MEKVNFCEGFMAQMMVEEAWKEISGDFSFNEAQLDKYADKINWEEISMNCQMRWSISMLEKFKRKIDWSKLSHYLCKECMYPEVIEKFKDYWDWEELSDNSELTMEIVEQFADYFNWRELINSYFVRECNPEEFLEKFHDRIPATAFKGSRLWNALVVKREAEIKKEICLD